MIKRLINKFLPKHIVVSITLCVALLVVKAQKSTIIDAKGLIYIDQKGLMRNVSDNAEVSFFGVNYTVPFAFTYRAIQRLDLSHEKVISEDVYHMSRLGVDAFRVHIWDTEISDSLGNLVENEHLRLYDFLIAKLKERNIKILLTPIAYWGNGYPENDIPTSGFSSYYSKDQAYRIPEAINAQSNYLQQLLKHINPYTKLAYREDTDIIAMEVCNEPSHSGDPAITTDFINKMVDACRSVNWRKPVFYNVSQNSPEFADAILNANIDGCTFQWYPEGLVRGHELEGNFLPYVDKYEIPYKKDPRFANMAKAVYEFETADILQSYMYPAVARSFREAGFQWATQFAYDPMALAYCNAEYPTHYLNLAYTPSKAISLLIASKVFHIVPLLKNYGTFPSDSVFNVFRVSYTESLSEMNAETEYYYTNNTDTKPLNTKSLQHIAGYGSSQVVTYNGYGAYFLDRLEDGIWRLEVMPDAINIRNPFDKPSLSKEVTRIEWKDHSMTVQLPDLGENFSISGLNDGNNFSSSAVNSEFNILPGTYLLIRKGKTNRDWFSSTGYKNIQLGEFVAPKPAFDYPYIVHEPFSEVTAGKSFKINIKAVGIDTSDRISLIVSGISKPIEFVQKTIYDFEAEVPANIVKPGILSYNIIVKKGSRYMSFPGGYPGSVYDWDYFHKDCWTTLVVNNTSPLEIFDAYNDIDNVEFSFNTYWQDQIKSDLLSTGTPGKLALGVSASNLTEGEHTACIRSYFGDKLKGRMADIPTFNEIVINAKASNCDTALIKLILISKNGSAFGSLIWVGKEFQEYHVPLSSFASDSMVLIPRPYPGFLPFWFNSRSAENIDLRNTEILEVAIGPGIKSTEYMNPTGFELKYVWFNSGNK